MTENLSFNLQIMLQRTAPDELGSPGIDLDENIMDFECCYNGMKTWEFVKICCM